MPALEVGRITNPEKPKKAKAKTETPAAAKRKKGVRSKVLRDLEAKNAQMATRLKKLRQANPARRDLMGAATHATVAGAGGVIASAVASAVTGNMASPMMKGGVRIAIGLAASVVAEMYASKSSIAIAAGYGACGALVDRGVEQLGVYDAIGLNMDGSSYFMGAEDDDLDYEVEDDDDVEVLDNQRRPMGAISVTDGPLDRVTGTPGTGGIVKGDKFREIMSRV